MRIEAGHGRRSLANFPRKRWARSDSVRAMHALVTGGGGFLGQSLVKALLQRGDSVRVLGRNDYPELSRLGAECVRGDVGDVAAVDRAVKGVDGIFHVAARVGYWGPRAEYEATNVRGTENVV